MNFKVLMISATLVFSLTQGCATTTTDPYTGEEKTSSQAKGAVIGAVAGAVLGNQVKGNKNTRQNARLAGAALGGLLGGSVGTYMDKQEAELRQELANSGVTVSREGDQIVLNMPGQITFEVGKATIQSNFYSILDSVADVLAKYTATKIEVAGHTDSTGSAQTNQILSQQRASSVASYLSRQGISQERLITVGYGKSQPIASNQTAAGREQNRRVELTLIPQKG